MSLKLAFKLEREIGNVMIDTEVELVHNIWSSHS